MRHKNFANLNAFFYINELILKVGNNKFNEFKIKLLIGK